LNGPQVVAAGEIVERQLVFSGGAAAGFVPGGAVFE